jgi:hypothetical protein
MPFELGLACSAAHNGGKHAYVLLEREPYRLDKTLSDIKGRDPYVYGRSPRRLIGCVLDALRREDNRSPDPRAVQAVANELTVECRRIKRKFYSSHPFTGSIFKELVLTSTVFATDIGLLEVKRSGARAV